MGPRLRKEAPHGSGQALPAGYYLPPIVPAPDLCSLNRQRRLNFLAAASILEAGLWEILGRIYKSRAPQ